SHSHRLRLQPVHEHELVAMPIKLTIKHGRRIAFWAGVAYSVFQAMHALRLVITIVTVPLMPEPPISAGAAIQNTTTINTVAGGVSATMSTSNGLSISR